VQLISLDEIATRSDAGFVLSYQQGNVEEEQEITGDGGSFADIFRINIAYVYARAYMHRLQLTTCNCESISFLDLVVFANNEDKNKRQGQDMLVLCCDPL
jgi:hypothetical protein